jgi:hypothetical protein
MAHYIAELIQAAETATAEDRPTRTAQCADAILDLWKHRHKLPKGSRPLEDFEPILKTLQSLDPSDGTPRYFRFPRMEANESKQDTETKKWLDLAETLDHAARVLIRHCLERATESVPESSKNWVALAEAAGIADDVDLRAIRIMIEEGDLLREPRRNDKAQMRRLEDRIKRAEDLKEAAAALGSDLRKQLDGQAGPTHAQLDHDLS